MPTLSPRVTRASCALSAFFAALAPLTAQVSPGPVTPAPVPITAVSAGPTADLPDASGHFEATNITTFQYSPIWPPWTMGTGTGIANNGSGFTFQNPNALDGTHVAFVQGLGTMSTPFTFAPGTWRLRFFGAQRKMQGVANRQVLQVKIGATEVFEAELQGTDYAVYTTRALWFPATTSAQVTFKGLNPYGGDNTAFVDKVELEPIGEWHDSATWDLGVPGPGATVVIPAGVEVVLRGNATVATVTVYGELLTSFDPAALNARWVMVHGTTARFEVGRELTPYEQTFTLTLTGTDTTENVMGAGSKFLMAMNGGTVELHGKPKGILLPDGRQRTWTKLAATVAANFAQITVTQPVPWEIGDEIVIAGSNYSDPNNYHDQAETRVITAVNGPVLSLAPAAGTSFGHFGATDGQVASTYTYANGTRSWTFDRRAEVGLLSHNVRVQGGDNPDITKFGGHVMIMRGPCCSSNLGGRGRFSSVEFFHLGQKQLLGRYPIHWHMQQDQGKGQFVKQCSVHRSFNRAVTIHGTENLVVEGNVAYDHIGHGVFLEDGSERFNKLYHNLALTTRKPPKPPDSPTNEALLPSDNSDNELQNRTPATFWITNPNNEFAGNVAAGTVGTGFWFIFPKDPQGLSGDPTQPYYSQYFNGLHPDHEPLGLFADNVCHSSSSGFDANDSLNADHTIQKNYPWAPTTTAFQYLDHFTVYACYAGLYTGFGGNVYEQIRFRECVLGDNFFNAVFAAFNVLESSLIVANTGSGFYSGQAYAYTVYDGAGRLFDSHCVGFTTTVPAASPTLLFDVGAATRHTWHRFHGLTFQPAGPPAIALPDYASAIPNYNEVHDLQEPRRWGIAIVDEDGSLGGLAGRTIVSNHPMMRSSLDVTQPNWVCYTAPNNPSAYSSPFQFGHLLIDHPGLTSPTFPHVNLPKVNLTRKLRNHAPVLFVNDYKTDAHKQFPVIMNPPGVPPQVSYAVDWPVLPSTHDVIVTLDDLKEMATGTSTMLTLGAIGDFASLQVKYLNNAPVQSFASMALLNAASVTGYFVDPAAPAPKPVWLRIVKAAGAMADTVRLTW